METAPAQHEWTKPTPTGWIAGLDSYPRIAVLAPTEAEALHELAVRREWWLSIPDRDEVRTGDYA